MVRALSYDLENNRLYNGIGGTADCIFSEHDKKGFHTYKVSLPNEPVEIKVSSNLNYQGASYLYAEILIRGNKMLNFQDKQALYLLNACSLDTFQVPAGNWDELFDSIVRNYNNRYIVCEKDIDMYFNELDDIVLKDGIHVYLNKTDQAGTEWKSSFLVVLHVFDKLTDIMRSRNESVLSDNAFFESRLLATCKRCLQRFSECYPTWEIKEDDRRLKRLSEKLFAVIGYINQYGKPLEYVNLLTHRP